MTEAIRRGGSFIAPKHKPKLRVNTSRHIRNAILLCVKQEWTFEEICGRYRNIDPTAIKKICEVGELSRSNIPQKDFAPEAAAASEANTAAAEEFSKAADEDFEEN